jgi:hypothetical protein
MRYDLNAGHIRKTGVGLSVAAAFLVLSGPLSAQEPKLRVTLEGHTESVRPLAFSPNGKTLASAGDEGSIKLWDVATAKSTATPENPRDCSWLMFSPDGKTLVSSGAYCNSTLFLKVTDKVATTLDRPEWASDRMAYSSDGKTVAVVRACRIQLWDVAARKYTVRFEPYEHEVEALAFTPDGKILASISKDGIRLWDVATGKENRAGRKTADKKQIEKLINDLGAVDDAEAEKSARELGEIGPPGVRHAQAGDRAAIADVATPGCRTGTSDHCGRRHPGCGLQSGLQDLGDSTLPHLRR